MNRPTANRPTAVVVGSTFGSHYARALTSPDSPARLVGILGQGSPRSRALADELAVPVLTDPGAVEGVDLAVVAVRSTMIGGTGDELARALLRQGCSVLQELPVHTTDIAATLRVARECGRRFAVTPYYSHLASIRALAAPFAALRADGLESVTVRTSTQVLHLATLVLAQLLDATPGPARVTSGSRADRRLISSTWTGRGHVDVGVDIVLHHRQDPDDPDNRCQPLLALAATADAGELVLDHVHGPARWLPRSHTTSDGLLRPQTPAADTLPGPATHEPTGAEVVESLWPAAVHHAVAELLGPAPALPDQRQLACLRWWERVSAELGPAEVCRATPPRVLDLTGAPS